MIFLKEKASNTLITLNQSQKPMHMSKLAREAGVTFVYLSQLLPMFQQMNLVNVSQKGKFKIVSLTEKGEEMAKLLSDVKKAEGEQ